MPINHKIILKKFIDHIELKLNRIFLDRYGLELSLKTSNLTEEEQREILRLYQLTDEQWEQEQSTHSGVIFDKDGLPHFINNN
jgi:hypothetical protein